MTSPKVSTNPPPPILAALAVVSLIAVGFLGVMIVVMVMADFVFGFVITLVGGTVVGVVAYGLWRGQRRGSQILAVCFGAILTFALEDTQGLGFFTALLGIALIILVLVPASSRAWFDPWR